MLQGAIKCNRPSLNVVLLRAVQSVSKLVAALVAVVVVALLKVMIPSPVKHRKAGIRDGGNVQ